MQRQVHNFSNRLLLSLARLDGEEKLLLTFWSHYNLCTTLRQQQLKKAWRLFNMLAFQLKSLTLFKFGQLGGLVTATTS